MLNLAVESVDSAGLPQHSVSGNEGKLLHLLARLQRARTILEIGTLGAYSTIWLARSLPNDGQLITVEVNLDHAEVARANIERAGLAELVELREGHGLEILEQLSNEKKGPFDLIFIDADKRNNPQYFEWSLRLSRQNTLIIVDNVVRGGDVIDPQSNDASIRGVRELFEKLSSDSRVSATAIQTVGSKGHDGFILAIVNDE